MKSGIIRTTYLILTMALLAGQDAIAAKVYQWTDEEGVVHFSDAPPKDNASTEIQEIDIVSFDENNTDPDEYSIVNQLERMTEWRKQATEERLARKQLQLEARRIDNEKHASRYNVTPRVYYQPVYQPYPVYFNRGWKGHGLHVPGYHSGSGHNGNYSNSSFQFRSHHFRVGATY